MEKQEYFKDNGHPKERGIFSDIREKKNEELSLFDYLRARPVRVLKDVARSEPLKFPSRSL